MVDTYDQKQKIASKKKESSLDFFLQTLWEDRISGVDIPPFDISHTITPENVSYLLNLYPFLQIVNPTATFSAGIIAKFLKAKSGWTIHDYGDAMSTSLGELLYAGSEYHPLPIEDEGTSGGESGTTTLNPGKGTLVKQAFDTAVEMVEIAQQKGWPGIHIVAGTSIMQWATWLAAEKYHLEITGYVPDKNAKDKRDRLHKELKEIFAAEPQP